MDARRKMVSRNTRIPFAAVALLVSAIGVGTAGAQDGAGARPAGDLLVKARAMLQPVQGSGVSGSVDFFQAPDATAVHLVLMGVEAGDHGFHIHESGSCEGPKADAAGDHWNPVSRPHGGPADAPDARHAGDLGNVKAGTDRKVDQWLQFKALDVEGADGIVGKAVIVHKQADDLKSQPSGNSGDPIACGVIVAAGATTVRESSR